MAVHERLKYARKHAGLSLSQVKQRSQIGESSLCEFENGKREPSLSQLQSLAGVYRRSIAFFLGEGPVAALPTVLWRKRPEQKAGEIEARFLRLCEQYHNLEMWCGAKAPVSLPATTIRDSASSYGYTDAEELAKRILMELQLGDRPAQCLLVVLEEVCGVKVFHMDFEPTGTAASVVSDVFGAAVLLNTKNARWRRNHDLAHELFHLLTWPIFHSNGEATIVAGEFEEKLATCFAANLLLPNDPFRTAINARTRKGKLAVESIYDIAREFDVSVDSVLWRIHYLYGRGVNNADQTRRDIEKSKAMAPLLEGREDPKSPHPWPARYRALALEAMRRGELAIGRFAEYLGITRQEAMRFVEQELPDGEEVQITPA